ncbi:uncharacterized protein L203_100527 [Cryptococcus depauperatus CBS 7841]|uniref:Uncharacterized protein n=1 Tax=Cryptococcus depauperatus CBS 7841 TaxID=1295531 RepID=A0AAJ8LZ30_9TREE
MSSNSLSKRRSKQQAENWDDDFEFSLPTPKRSNLAKEGSLEDEWDEDWDKSPLFPPAAAVGSRSTRGLSFSRGFSKIPSPLNVLPNSCEPLRHSSSYSKDLPPSPSPIPSSSQTPHRPLLSMKSSSSLTGEQEQKSRLRSGSTATDTDITPRKKLVKRQPSAPFMPILSSRRKVKISASALSCSSDHREGECYDPHCLSESASIPGYSRSSTLTTWPLMGSPTKSKVKLTPLSTSTGDAGGNNSFASTVKRLGSLSRKHGRRISGGWKFGTQSSSSSSNSGVGGSVNVGSMLTQPKEGKPLPLATVIGSPVKEDTDQVSKTNDLTDSPVVVDHPTQPQQQQQKSNHRPQPSDQWDQDFPISSTMLLKLDQVEKSAAHEKTLLAEAEKKKKEDKQRRRQSWNDFVIPRNVMEKQKDLKEGISAVRQFAGGLDTLKNLVSIHSELCNHIYSAGSVNQTLKFDALEAEFAQWWEMAVVLIEVGSTGKDGGFVASVESPKRERRVTLATEEARSAGEVLKQVVPPSPSSSYLLLPSSFATTLQIISSTRKISLPDPEGSPSLNGPPRASPPPEQWRASTGRQDLSRRQLEVLKTMLKTPVSNKSSLSRSAGRPTMMRGTTTLSVRTGLTERFEQTAEPEIDQTQQLNRTLMLRDQTQLRINTSSPQISDTDVVLASSKLKDSRRMSKAGLAGLKEFLRSLKREKYDSENGEKRPAPRRIKSRSKVREGIVFTEVDQGKIKSSTSPIRPKSPTKISGWSRNPQSPSAASSLAEDQDQTSRSAFAALGPSSSPFSTPGTVLALQSQLSSSRITSQSPVPVVTPSKPAAIPKRPNIRNIFRTSSGNWGDLVGVSNSSPSSVGSGKDGSHSLRKRGSTQLLEQKSGRLTKDKDEVIDDKRRTRKEKARPQTAGSLSGQIAGVTRNSISVSDPLPHLHRGHSATEIEITITEKGVAESDMTLKPKRRSCNTSTKLGIGWPEKKTDEDTHSPASQLIPDGLHAASTSTSNAVNIAGETGRETEDEEEIVVALTPENLPALLEYLRQCEAKLEEWKERMTREGLIGMMDRQVSRVNGFQTEK